MNSKNKTIPMESKAKPSLKRRRGGGGVGLFMRSKLGQLLQRLSHMTINVRRVAWCSGSLLIGTKQKQKLWARTHNALPARGKHAEMRHGLKKNR